MHVDWFAPRQVVAAVQQHAGGEKQKASRSQPKRGRPTPASLATMPRHVHAHFHHKLVKMAAALKQMKRRTSKLSPIISA
jgi:hypothetical protein